MIQFFVHMIYSIDELLFFHEVYILLIVYFSLISSFWFRIFFQYFCLFIEFYFHIINWLFISITGLYGLGKVIESFLSFFLNLTIILLNSAAEILSKSFWTRDTPIELEILRWNKLNFKMKQCPGFSCLLSFCTGIYCLKLDYQLIIIL